MSFKIALIIPLLFLAGCGTLIKGQTQSVTLVATGAEEAECTLDHGVRYKLRNGETANIMRSGSDMTVECYASGNRHKKFVIPRGFNAWSAANITNGLVPGVSYDHFSKGLYEYPEQITVDFSGKAPGFDLPDYHNIDAPNPYDQKIEDYTPGTPRIERDSTYQRRAVERTGMGMEGANPYSREPLIHGGITSMPSGNSATGSLSSPNAAWTPAPITPSLPPVPRGGDSDSLTRAMNPSVFGGNQ